MDSGFSLKYNFLFAYFAPGFLTVPFILRTFVGVSALEVTVMAFLIGPTLLVSYFTSIFPVFPGIIGLDKCLDLAILYSHKITSAKIKRLADRTIEDSTPGK